MEEWRKLTGHSVIDGYEISNLGRIRHTNNGSILKTYVVSQGFEYCMLHLNGGARRQFAVHRLVAETFLDKVEGARYVDHVDGNKLNNHANNLRWIVHPNIKSCNKNKRVLLVETGETFISVTKCAESLHKRGISATASNISMCCNGVSKTHLGYHFKYV